jgi:hypothetical protein
MNGAIKDRGIELVTPDYDPDSSYNSNYRTLQALVISPGHDYHWYRRDEDGTWSHKPGSSSATNRDNSNHIIYNPETANRGGTARFVAIPGQIHLQWEEEQDVQMAIKEAVMSLLVVYLTLTH